MVQNFSFLGSFWHCDLPFGGMILLLETAASQLLKSVGHGDPSLTESGDQGRDPCCSEVLLLLTVTASLRPLGQQGLLFRALSGPAWQYTLKTVTLEYEQQPEIVH